MLTFVSFIIVMIGSLNWFFIAAFQYDFIAGFFGTQASLLSRLVYFIIGMASFVLIAMALKNKGKIKITENSFKQNFKKPENKASKNGKNNEDDNGKNKDNEDNDEKYKHDKNDKRNYNKNRSKSNQKSANSKNGENSAKDNNDTDESEKTLNLVPYGYKDFDITQYDD